MNTEFCRPITRGGYSEHHQAANIVGEARPFPDISVNVGIDDILQRLAELAEASIRFSTSASPNIRFRRRKPRAYSSLISTCFPLS